jgi:hypothetical protein
MKRLPEFLFWVGVTAAGSAYCIHCLFRIGLIAPFVAMGALIGWAAHRSTAE